MAKANKKEKELEAGSGEVSTPMAGMTAKDLSLEKRIELYNVAFEAFKKDAEENYGLRLTVELVNTPQAIVPRMSVIDLLKNPDGNQTKDPSSKAESKA